MTGATVVAIWKDDGTVSAASADTLIDESTLIVIGPYDNVDRLATFMGGPSPGGRVALVGAGRVGQEAGKMLNHAGIKPDVIDIKDRHLYFEGNFINGDATKPHILQKAKIKEVDTLIVTINDDSLNIFVALTCKQLNPQIDIVARAVNADVVPRMHQAGVNHVLSESIMGFQLLQVAMVDIGVLPKLSNYKICEVIWKNEPIIIRELNEIYEGDTKIICVIRDGEVIETSADFSLAKDDRVVILGTTEDVKKFIDLAS